MQVAVAGTCENPGEFVKGHVTDTLGDFHGQPLPVHALVLASAESILQQQQQAAFNLSIVRALLPNVGFLWSYTTARCLLR